MFDHSKQEMTLNLSKHTKLSIASVSTRKDSASSSNSGSSQIEDTSSDESQKAVKFRCGDKFTKKPIQYGKYLVLLGRIHIHLFDTETLETKILLHVGEDQAEKFGQHLKENPNMIK